MLKNIYIKSRCVECCLESRSHNLFEDLRHAKCGVILSLERKD